MRGSRQQAVGGRQTGPKAAALGGAGAFAAGMVLLLSAAGCSEKTAPAAAKSSSSDSATLTATAPPSSVEHVAISNANSEPAPNATAEAQVAAAASAESAPAEPVAPASAPKAEPAAVDPKKPTRDISFDTIKFDMKKEDPFDQKLLTPTVKKLVDNKVRIRGYILPSFQQTGLKQFVLVRDNLECCFGPGAALYDCVVVQMNEGKSTDFTTRPVAVEGVFSLDELRDADGKCLAVYHLQGDKVQ